MAPCVLKHQVQDEQAEHAHALEARRCSEPLRPQVSAWADSRRAFIRGETPVLLPFCTADAPGAADADGCAAPGGRASARGGAGAAAGVAPPAAAGAAAAHRLRGDRGVGGERVL